ncbi:hypothetical protein [Halobacillus salinus]|uniref:hypothetical protein n=1 Tax=Halobacillus salinus TaxID=192814 RepID=UPI00130526E7|nr:hypothetical protein [Halobacillus salinus]
MDKDKMTEAEKWQEIERLQKIEKKQREVLNQLKGDQPDRIRTDGNGKVIIEE